MLNYSEIPKGKRLFNQIGSNGFSIIGKTNKYVNIKCCTCSCTYQLSVYYSGRQLLCPKCFLSGGLNKQCSNCNIALPHSSFHYSKPSFDKTKPSCKSCRRINETSLYYAANKEKLDAKVLTWIRENKDRARATGKASRSKPQNKIRMLAYRKANRSGQEKKRYDSNPLHRFKIGCRALIKQAIKRVGTRSASVSKLLGCSYEQFFNHLTNNGQTSRVNMHIDHICPVSQATNIVEMEKLQHFSNLRLLTSAENRNKGDRPTPEAVAKCRELLGREWI